MCDTTQAEYKHWSCHLKVIHSLLHYTAPLSVIKDKKRRCKHKLERVNY